MITTQKYLLDEEYQRLEEILNKFKDKDERNATLLWLLIHTGARATEVLNLTKEDLCPKNKAVLIKGIKGSNTREIPLPPWLFKRLQELSENTETIFPITYHRLRQIWLEYRPVKKKIHSLRHTFAIRLYSRTKDLRLVKIALGHRSIMNTMVYADYIYTQQEMKRIIE